MAIRKKAGPAPPPRKDATQVSKPEATAEGVANKDEEVVAAQAPALRVVSPPLVAPPIRRTSSAPPPPEASFQVSLGDLSFRFRGKAPSDGDIAELTKAIDSVDAVANVCTALRRLRAFTPFEVVGDSAVNASEKWLELLDDADRRIQAEVQEFLAAGGDEDFLRRSS